MNDGASLVDKWQKNCKWMEGSAKTDEGIQDAFNEIIKLIENKRENSKILLKQKNKKKDKHPKCSIQ